MKNAVSKSAGLSLFLGGIGSAAAQFCQNGGGYGKQEDTGQAQKFAACKHAQQGGCGGKAHLKADDFRLQGLADHCYEQIQAHKTQGQAFGTGHPGYERPGKEHGARAQHRQNIHQRGDAGQGESGRNAKDQESDIKFRKCQKQLKRISPQKPAGNIPYMEKYLQEHLPSVAGNLAQQEIQRLPVAACQEK